MHVLRRGPRTGWLGRGIRQIRAQPLERRQAAGMRRNVLDQGAAGWRRRRAFRHLSPAGDDARGARHRRHSAVGLGRGVWTSRRGQGPTGSQRRTAIARHDGEQVMKQFAGLLMLPLVLCLAACGERPQVVNYKQGTYQGKPDTPPYNAAPFNGDKTQWERALETRAQNQNEYKRIR